jgi:alkanesulfonate monooxygenase SsuD/methylene tetrahydromethanopterin reductase-like flavin-dependent oxidoreductase (luciferase family)
MAVTNVGQRYVTPERSAEDIAQALCLTGTPQDCIAGIETRIEAGVRDFTLGFLGSTDQERLRQMELFAQQVMPYFRK